MVILVSPMGTSKNRGFFWSKFLLKQKANGKLSDHFFVEQAGKIHLLDPQQVLINLCVELSVYSWFVSKLNFQPVM